MPCPRRALAVQVLRFYGRLKQSFDSPDLRPNGPPFGHTFARPEPVLVVAVAVSAGPPEPFAPPCIRHLARPLTAACRQECPARVRAPHRRAAAILPSRRSISAAIAQSPNCA